MGQGDGPRLIDCSNSLIDQLFKNSLILIKHRDFAAKRYYRPLETLQKGLQNRVSEFVAAPLFTPEEGRV